MAEQPVQNGAGHPHLQHRGNIHEEREHAAVATERFRDRGGPHRELHQVPVPVPRRARPRRDTAGGDPLRQRPGPGAAFRRSSSPRLPADTAIWLEMVLPW
ncbi:hypothetical protein ACFU93_27090 [Streptomyces sp. NPDC057611]|uniref:hypothetical protein n=1 Tax=Streptomyces sp. NPDC057611 TaxID=3346182 RepID=UPI0036813053